MTAVDDLLAKAEAMSALLPLFVKSSPSMYLRTEDQAQFKRLALESKAILDDELGRANDFSMNLIHAVNSGSGGFFGGPSYACVSESEAIVRGAVSHLRRKPLAAQIGLSGGATKAPYVDPSRLAELRGTSGRAYDPSRLAQLCGELNVAHERDCFMSVAMLVRAIVDHIPPVLSCGNFDEVANNYKGSSSFKRSMQNLNKSLRNIADSHLHQQIRTSEVLPTAVQVDFKADLDVLLAEVLRVLRAST